MKYILKSISSIFLLISFVSCDSLSGLLTTNYFEQFEGVDPFSVFVGDDETTFDDLTEEEKSALIDDYVEASLSIEDSDSLYESLIEQPDFRDDVTTYIKDYLDNNIPNPTSETYSEDLIKYQKRAITLANIEVYTNGAVGIDGFDNLFISYTSGELEGTLTQEVLLTEVFGITIDPTLTGTERSEKITELKTDIEASLRAGEALNQLGDTIVDLDNPYSEALSANDGVLVLMSCMINRIIELSLGDFSSETDVINALVTGIVDNSLSISSITFPQDVEDSSLTPIQRYLGEGGALAYTATGFSLPSISLFGGNNE